MTDKQDKELREQVIGLLNKARDEQRYLTGGFGIATTPYADIILAKVKAHYEQQIQEARKDGYKKGVFADKKFGEMDVLEAVDGAGLKPEEIAKVLANTLGTKLKFESRLTDQDRLAFKDEMRLELHAVINAQLQAIKKLFEEEK